MEWGGNGNFVLARRTLIAQPDSNGIRLLYYAPERLDDFSLRLDFCLPHPRGNSNDNSLNRSFCRLLGK